jgi:hypothetical protein
MCQAMNEKRSTLHKWRRPGKSGGLSVKKKTPDSFFSTVTLTRSIRNPPETLRVTASCGLKDFAPLLSRVMPLSPLSGMAGTDLMGK